MGSNFGSSNDFLDSHFIFDQQDKEMKKNIYYKSIWPLD